LSAGLPIPIPNAQLKYGVDTTVSASTTTSSKTGHIIIQNTRETVLRIRTVSQDRIPAVPTMVKVEHNECIGLVQTDRPVQVDSHCSQSTTESRTASKPVKVPLHTLQHLAWHDRMHQWFAWKCRSSTGSTSRCWAQRLHKRPLKRPFNIAIKANETGESNASSEYWNTQKTNTPCGRSPHSLSGGRERESPSLDSTSLHRTPILHMIVQAIPSAAYKCVRDCILAHE